MQVEALELICRLERLSYQEPDEITNLSFDISLSSNAILNELSTWIIQSEPNCLGALVAFGCLPMHHIDKENKIGLIHSWVCGAENRQKHNFIYEISSFWELASFASKVDDIIVQRVSP